MQRLSLLSAWRPIVCCMVWWRLIVDRLRHSRGITPQPHILRCMCDCPSRGLIHAYSLSSCNGHGPGFGGRNG